MRALGQAVALSAPASRIRTGDAREGLGVNKLLPEPQPGRRHDLEREPVDRDREVPLSKDRQSERWPVVAFATRLRPGDSRPLTSAFTRSNAV